jgi:hypothetical protein
MALIWDFEGHKKLKKFQAPSKNICPCLNQAKARAGDKGMYLTRRVKRKEKEMRKRGEEQEKMGCYTFLQHLMPQPTVVNV